MEMIYAERLDSSGVILEKGVFLSWIELCTADRNAREQGSKWSGTLETNIALNRYRHNRCLYCGAHVGQEHKDCTVGRINRCE